MGAIYAINLFSAIQHRAPHPTPDQRRSEGGERAVARRAAGDEPRPQGDAGGPGAFHCKDFQKSR